MEPKTIDQYLGECVETLKQMFAGFSQVKGQFVKFEAAVLGSENAVSVVVEEFSPAGVVKRHTKHGKLLATPVSGYGTPRQSSTGERLRFHSGRFTPAEVQQIAEDLSAQQKQG